MHLSGPPKVFHAAGFFCPGPETKDVLTCSDCQGKMDSGIYFAFRYSVGRQGESGCVDMVLSPE
jgi:hypothetical protein